MITGAIFDMDGLLFDTERVYQKLWHQIAEERDIKLDSSFTRLISGSSGDVAARLIVEHYKVDDPLLIFKECGRRMLEATENHIDVMPGVMEMLHFLRSKNIKCTVASGSSTEQVLQNLRVAGMEELFDAVVGGNELKYGKPNPHIFLYAAEKIQCDSHDCLVFEDSPNGIKAASAAEAHPIMIPDMTEPTDEIITLCDGIYPSMHEALEAIRTRTDYFGL